MTRYQELAALIEVSAILGRMSSSQAWILSTLYVESSLRCLKTKGKRGLQARAHLSPMSAARSQPGRMQAGGLDLEHEKAA